MRIAFTLHRRTACNALVAHEVASILLKTDDETAIQLQMAKWEQKSSIQDGFARPPSRVPLAFL